MLTDIKYLKYIKHLCWSNKVKQGKSWECHVYDNEICVFTSRWGQFGYGDLLSYLDTCIMPFVIDALLAIVVKWGCGMCVF